MGHRGPGTAAKPFRALVVGPAVVRRLSNQPHRPKTAGPTPSHTLMTSTFPFEVAAAKTTANPARQFAIVAHAGKLEDYHDLFEDFGFVGSGASWREHLETIIEEFQPELLDHLEFDETGDTFLAYADSPDTVRAFLACVQPYFGDLAKLEKYFQQTDPEDFFQ